MKHPIVYSAIAAALVSIIGKMVYHIFLAPDGIFDMYTRFFYLLCFLLAIFFGFRIWKIQNPHKPFTDDIKSGMQIVSIFALIIAAFTWIYYKWINPHYFEYKIQQTVNAASNSTPIDGADVDIEQIQHTASLIFNAATHSSLTLFGIIVMGFFYTIIIVMLFRWRPSAFGISR
ncbi:MAG: DUF4199 domain-containing protein [Salibacteraceae bacterium]